MNRDEMVEGIMRASGINKANVNRFYDGLIALAKKKLASEGLFVLPGLGVLRVRTHKARDGRHVQAGVGNIPFQYFRQNFLYQSANAICP